MKGYKGMQYFNKLTQEEQEKWLEQLQDLIIAKYKEGHSQVWSENIIQKQLNVTASVIDIATSRKRFKNTILALKG